MKPLVTTVRAVSELATGLSPDAVSESEVLFKFSTPEIDLLLAADDDEAVQRIVIMREQNTKDPYVPEHLVAIRRDVLSRRASLLRGQGPLAHYLCRDNGTSTSIITTSPFSWQGSMT